MDRIYLFRLLKHLFAPLFKLTVDSRGNSYVLLAQQHFKNDRNKLEINNRTEYETLENRMNLFSYISKKEKKYFSVLAQKIGIHMMEELYRSFPEKNFVFYAEILWNGDFTTTFHQIWDGEEPYIDMNKLKNDKKYTVYQFTRQNGIISIKSNQSKCREKAIQRYRMKLER